MRIRADPDPKHWYAYIKGFRWVRAKNMYISLEEQTATPHRLRRRWGVAVRSTSYIHIFLGLES